MTNYLVTPPPFVIKYQYNNSLHKVIKTIWSWNTFKNMWSGYPTEKWSMKMVGTV